MKIASLSHFLDLDWLWNADIAKMRHAIDALKKVRHVSQIYFPYHMPRDITYRCANLSCKHQKIGLLIKI